MRIIDGKKPIKAWVDHVNLEPEAEEQLKNLASLPFIYKHVAVMPDAHAGKGSTVGTVIATKGAIIPAAVGVDIGCGMCAVKLPLVRDDIKDLSTLRHSIERSVPVGFNHHKELNSNYSEHYSHLSDTFGRYGVDQKTLLQCGTLGGGNHFIELCEDTLGGIWVVLHSGSRGIGNKLATVHIDKAKSLMKEYFISLPDPDLAYLAQNTSEFKYYLQDLLWAQDYAKFNRTIMMDLVLREIGYHIKQDKLFFLDKKIEEINCHHNFTQLENHFGNNVWITRKGAVQAQEGQYGIIPGSMGTKSYIVKGKGNVESFCSCSHGAGRNMSRTKARATFTADDLVKQTEGVECRKDEGVVDEIPGAYKDIDLVMKSQEDLVEVVYTLKQFMCIKG
jgi:tRNA-splicing ligase RtcB